MALLKRKKKDKGQSASRQMWNRAFAVLIVLMAGSAVIYGIFALTLSSSPFVPKDADGVLKSVDMPDSYSWSSESVRLFPVAGETIQQDAVRAATLKSSENKYQIQETGVLPYSAFFAGDETMTVKMAESTISGEDPTFRKVTDVCGGKPPIPVETVEMPSTEMLLNANPSLVTDQGTVMGDQAWVIDFEVTPEIFRQALMIDFFQKATVGQPEEAWIISEKEQEEVNAGEFETVSASVWVNRKGDHLIRQIDFRVEMKSGSKYRVLAQYVPNDDENPLKNVDLGDGGCDLLPSES